MDIKSMVGDCGISVKFTLFIKEKKVVTALFLIKLTFGSSKATTCVVK